MCGRACCLGSSARGAGVVVLSGVVIGHRLRERGGGELVAVAFEFHQYFDADFSGTKAECATSEGDTKLADATAWLKANNYRGFLGEFGGGNNAACQATIGRVLQYLETNKQWIGWTWWAAGPWWGNYFMSLERTTSGADVAQMSWLTPFLK
ncbi:MAG: hypothetical protein EOO68_13315 [Moraxellaceae bacterium]|nr:MAG: hypothetical protein EOO68_13315 [Moraxellaceae bacterium]